MFLAACDEQRYDAPMATNLDVRGLTVEVTRYIWLDDPDGMRIEFWLRTE